jgi:uncharacterized protein
LARRPGFASRLALAAIRGYQRHLSPHKGFSCAYRCATGRDSCSAHGYRVIARCGLWNGLALLRRRLRLCGETHRSRARVVPNPLLHYQKGDCIPCDCDGGCVPDLPFSGKTAHDCACDCGCDVLERYLEKKYERAKDLWYRWREQRRRRPPPPPRT